MRAILLSGLLLTSSALAEPTLTVLGWTADGTSLVYKTTDETGAQDEDGNYAGSTQLAVVVDATPQAAQQPYLLALGSTTAEEKKRYHALPNRQAFELWLAAHPVSCARGRESPDGKARAEIKLKGKAFAGAWKGKAGKAQGSHYVISPKEDDDNGPSAEAFQAVFSVKADGVEWPTSEFEGRVAFYGTAQGSDVNLCWSLDGKRVAWTVHSSRTMRDPESNELRITTAEMTLDPEGARTVARRAATLARRANARGMKAYRAKDYPGAAKQFEEAIAADSGFVNGHYNRACVAGLQDDKQTALRELKWLAASPDPAAKAKLKKAATDPDLRSLSGDPEVKALLGL